MQSNIPSAENQYNCHTLPKGSSTKFMPHYIFPAELVLEIRCSATLRAWIIHFSSAGGIFCPSEIMIWWKPFHNILGTCWKAFINEILYQNINFFFKFLEAIFQVIFKLLILAILWKFCKSTIPCYFYLCETLSIRVTLNKPASEIPWFLRQK